MGTMDIQDRYINPYTDFGFKKLFGTEMNKDLLISFINSLLHGEEVVMDLTYLNTEHLGTTEADRRAIFDVYCDVRLCSGLLLLVRRVLSFASVRRDDYERFDRDFGRNA